jgi:hypothetical protein
MDLFLTSSPFSVILIRKWSSYELKELSNCLKLQTQIFLPDLQLCLFFLQPAFAE